MYLYMYHPYIYIYVYMYTSPYIHLCRNIKTYIYIWIYTYIHMYMHTLIYRESAVASLALIVPSAVEAFLDFFFSSRENKKLMSKRVAGLDKKETYVHVCVYMYLYDEMFIVMYLQICVLRKYVYIYEHIIRNCWVRK
jgi:hypothetical protein